MSNEMQQITPFDGYGGEVVEYQPAQPGPTRGTPQVDDVAPPGIVKKIHNSLRGRYWIGILIGSILGGAGGYFGFKSQQPIYRGEGMIQIAMQTKGVMFNGPESAIINFEEYVQSQAMMITSRRVIDLAMRGPDWKSTTLPEDAPIQNIIAANLTVEHPSRTELIKVYYTDKNPEIAGNVVKAIVLAYYNFAIGKNQQEDGKRMRLLDDRRSLLMSQIVVLDRQILEAANLFGTADLSGLVEAKLAEETKIEQRMHEAELALDAAKRKKDAKQAIVDLTENQIAMIDPVMRGHVVEREAVNTEIARLRAAGMLPENVKMKQLTTLVDIQQKKVDKYAAEWRDLQMRLSEDPTLSSGGIPRIMQLSPAVMQQEVASLQKKYEELKRDRTEIGRHMLKIQDLQRQREEAIKEKNDVQARMTVLQMEGNMASRMSVINPGDVPITPFKDRRKMMGAAGALGGFGLPMGFLVLIGLMDRRYRFSDEANNGVSNVPLLGILPRLPDKLSDPEQASMAAHCIHQIRIMLQVGQDPDSRRAFMITSASSGDGKTSLTMALGLSFAASGSKTLVIDCDMIGQGLTHRLKADNVPGLIETLNMGTLRGHVRKTASKGLYVLPIGNADAVHAGVLSPQSIRRLMAACREHFDIVIIDTGPILGSLEASVVATEVDGVIIAVARGQQQPLVDKAIKHLRSVGAKIFGIVFNRAEQRDFQRSVASASIRSQSAKQGEQRLLLPESDESARFGPLARSVASCLPDSASHAGSARNGDSPR